MLSMATKIMGHVVCIIVDQNTKYNEYWAETDDTTTRSCFSQEYF